MLPENSGHFWESPFLLDLWIQKEMGGKKKSGASQMRLFSKLRGV
jgi:hypothetical protein